MNIELTSSPYAYATVAPPPDKITRGTLNLFTAAIRYATLLLFKQVV
jgi:hypothetical protein